MLRDRDSIGGIVPDVAGDTGSPEQNGGGPAWSSSSSHDPGAGRAPLGISTPTSGEQGATAQVLEEMLVSSPASRSSPRASPEKDYSGGAMDVDRPASSPLDTSSSVLGTVSHQPVSQKRRQSFRSKTAEPGQLAQTLLHLDQRRSFAEPKCATSSKHEESESDSSDDLDAEKPCGATGGASSESASREDLAIAGRGDEEGGRGEHYVLHPEQPSSSTTCRRTGADHGPPLRVEGADITPSSPQKSAEKCSDVAVQLAAQLSRATEVADRWEKLTPQLQQWWSSSSALEEQQTRALLDVHPLLAQQTEQNSNINEVLKSLLASFAEHREELAQRTEEAFARTARKIAEGHVAVEMLGNRLEAVGSRMEAMDHSVSLEQDGSRSRGSVSLELGKGVTIL